MGADIIKMPGILRYQDKKQDRLKQAIELCLEIEARQMDRIKTIGSLPPLYTAALGDIIKARRMLQRASRKLTGAN